MMTIESFQMSLISDVCGAVYSKRVGIVLHCETSSVLVRLTF